MATAKKKENSEIKKDGKNDKNNRTERKNT